MNEPSGRWVDVGAESDLPPGSAVAVSAGGAGVAVFNVEGEWLAVEGRCLHKGGALAEGLVSGGVVTCPLHWWRYDLRTGQRLGAPDLRLACYPVRITEGHVEVLVPPAVPAPPSLRDRLLAAARPAERADRRAHP